MPSKTNQRHHRRVECGAPAKADGPRGPMRGVCSTLSSAGMFFLGPAMPIGQSLHLSVDLPGGKFEADGEVRYHHTSESGKGMGIRFTRLAQEDLAKIQKFIEAVP
jgi:hypothetical protein